jgi:membrane protease subunit (stomatin/prohibitin family)
MGFMEKLRAEFIDIVEWLDDSRHTLVWRFPRYHNQIKQGARLIVRPGQVAAFVHKGKLADVFDTGTHVLSTENLPVLSTLQGWKHGFDSPFKAEIYFVATRQVVDLKWGTPNPVITRDPGFGPVRIRAFGSYTLKATDPRTLITEVVGTDSEFEADEIEVLIRSIINNAFADLVAKSNISVFELASNYGPLSEKLRRAVIERIDDEYGLDIPQLYIVNISLPEEVERAIDARSSMGVIGDLAQYQQYQLGQSIPVAAENPAGGLAAAGVGLGMGMAYAGRMMPGGPQGVVPPPPLSWHIVDNGTTAGPLNMQQLAEAARMGRVGPATLVWTAGMPGWVPAGQIPQIASLFQESAPPPPPPPPPSATPGE